MNPSEPPAPVPAKFAGDRRRPRVIALIEAMACGWAAFVLGLGILAWVQAPAIAWQLKAGTAIASLAVLFGVRRWCARSAGNGIEWDRVGIVFIIATVAATFWWAWHFDTVQNSDFGIYFRCGRHVGSDIGQWIDACQSAYLHKNLVYWGRSLLYTAPLNAISDGSYPALKLFNAALHAATTVLWFLGLRHYYGARTATVASVLLALYPEWWFTTTLATTDNAAVLCIVAFVLLLPKLNASTHPVLVVVGLAASVFAANLLRNVGPLLVAGLLLWLVVGRCNRYAIGRAVAVVALYSLANRVVGGMLPPLVAEPLPTLKMMSAIDFNSMQDFASNYPWGEHFWFAIEDGERARVALDKISLEIFNGFQRWPAYLYDKAASLFTGSGYYAFSSFQNFGINPDTVQNVPRSTVPFVPSTLPWLGAAVAFLLLPAMWTIVTTRVTGPALAAVLWLGAFALIVLGMSEAQPRYSLLIAPTLALLAALALSQRTPPELPRTAGIRFTAIGCAVIAAAFALVAAAIPVVGSTRSNPLLHAAAVPPTSAPECAPQPPARIEATYKRLRIVMPPGSDCASVVLPLSAGTKELAFFVSGAKLPFLWEPPLQSPFRYSLKLDDRVLLDAALGEKPVRWHRVPVDARATRTTLTVRRDDATGEDFIDIGLYTERR